MAARRWLALLLAVSLGMGAGLQPSPALAVPRGYVLVGARLEVNFISPPTPPPLCVGEERRLGALLDTVLEYKDPAGRSVFYLRATGRAERIRITSGDPGVASALPAVAVQAPRGVLPYVIFVITGKRVGRTTLSVSDETFGQASPRSDPIEVVDCHYEVTISSAWRLTKGFRPTLHASLTQVPLRPTGVFNSYLAAPRMANSATAPPSGGCIVTFAIGRSDVMIAANPDPQRQSVLVVTVVYGTLPKATVEVCHQPKVIGVGEGSGQPWPLTFRIDAQARSTTKTLRHVIDANEVVTGSTEITITRVPN